MREAGKAIGQATIYQTLNELAWQGQVDIAVSERGERLFRWGAGKDHHHHIVCRSCGFGIEIESAEFERRVEVLGKEHGLSELRHRFEHFGTCSTCRGPPPH
jgi:Fur family ferric uptake transcriptional regulator